jgi:hypothetical protein
MLPSACSFIVEVSCHCFTPHVSGYMAIFRCVGCYYSRVLEGICFAGFFLYLARGYTLCVVVILCVSICVFLFYFSFYFFCFLRACLSAYLFVLRYITIKRQLRNMETLPGTRLSKFLIFCPSNSKGDNLKQVLATGY